MVNYLKDKDEFHINVDGISYICFIFDLKFRLDKRLASVVAYEIKEIKIFWMKFAYKKFFCTYVLDVPLKIKRVKGQVFYNPKEIFTILEGKIKKSRKIIKLSKSNR